MESTQRNIEASTQLLSTQAGHEKSKALITQIQSYYEDLKQELQIEGMTLNNRESESRINLNIKKLAEIDAIIAQIHSVIKLNEQALETGKLSQWELVTKIQNIIADSKLKDELRITEGQTREAKTRSKTAVEFIDQGLNNINKAWRGWRR